MDDFDLEERPVRRVSVDGIWIDAHLVATPDFRRFVEPTGSRTGCER